MSQNAAAIERDRQRLADFPGLTPEEQALLPGLDTDLRDDCLGRHDAPSNALRKKLWVHGLTMCWPCQGSGVVNVELSTQSCERCEVCEGRGYTTDYISRVWAKRARSESDVAARTLDAMRRVMTA